MKKTTLKTLLLVFLLTTNYLAFGQCASTSNVYSFVHNGKTYEVIKENKSWADAAACAVQRGGILAEVNDLAEQNAIFTQLNSSAGITTSNTTAPDGGGASYVWIGGNDIATEGNWIWDGNNDGVGPQFWMGDFSGTAVGGLYTNWGGEPDNFGGTQNGLGLALTSWPFGGPGQWNDINPTNTLYYIVEHSTIVLSNKTWDINTEIKLSPNPVKNILSIDTNKINLSKITIINAIGQKVKSIENKDVLNAKKIDVSNLTNGLYFIKLHSVNGESIIKKIVKK